MEVTVHEEKLFSLLDLLVGRRKANQFPYNKKDAVIPQDVIPDAIRKDRKVHALFYFYACIYMRGGIESLQAFNALIRMWRFDPHLFDPQYMQMVDPAAMQAILKKYIGWDSKAASKNWVINSRRLMQHWQGDPLNLLKGLRTYEETLRRMRNKRSKRDLKAAGPDGEGFYGFQPKMASMLLYFYDWEGWLEERFLYPAPADFHNFRLGLAYGALVITPTQESVRASEKLSAPWREGLMNYLKARRADPIEVADALWLFSLVMCGNSPVSRTKKLLLEMPIIGETKPGQIAIFKPEEAPAYVDPMAVIKPRHWAALSKTCLRCPIRVECTMAIPSKPYYQKGLLLLQERPKVENHLPTVDPDLDLLPQEAPGETLKLALI